jgi:hypothetical protein
MSPKGDGPLTNRIRARKSGEQAQNQSKPTQLHAKPPWAKSKGSQEATQQSWAILDQAQVWPHPH